MIKINKELALGDNVELYNTIIQSLKEGKNVEVIKEIIINDVKEKEVTYIITNYYGENSNFNTVAYTNMETNKSGLKGLKEFLNTRTGFFKNGTKEKKRVIEITTIDKNGETNTLFKI